MAVFHLQITDTDHNSDHFQRHNCEAQGAFPFGEDYQLWRLPLRNSRLSTLKLPSSVSVRLLQLCWPRSCATVELVIEVDTSPRSLQALFLKVH